MRTDGVRATEAGPSDAGEGVEALWSRVHGTALAAPAEVAACCGEDSLTYADLDAHAQRLAAGLRDIGVRDGSVIAYVGRNSLVHPVVLVAASYARAVLVAVNWRGTVDDVRHVTEDAGASVIIVEPEFAPLVESTAAKHVWQAPDVKALVDCHGGDPTGLLEVAKPQVSSDELVNLTYTSGTTGRPKGVMISIGQLESYLTRRSPWTPRPDDVVLIVSPVFHTAGWVWVAYSLTHGATAVLVPDAAPEVVATAIQRWRPTLTLLVPALIRILLQHAHARAALADVRMLTYGAAAMPLDLLADLAEAAPHAALVQGYGLSETTGSITALLPEDHQLPAPHLGSVGRALPGIEIAVFDPLTHEQVAEGELGEVRTRSTQNCAGYWGNREGTERLFHDGWLCTGDMGRMVDGYVYLVDRLDDIIRSGAEKVPPSEVEAVIAAIPGVAEVCVVGVPDETWGQVVSAVVVVEPGADVSAETIQQVCRERLAGYMIPRSVRFVEQLPRNANGKLMRKVVRDGR